MMAQSKLIRNLRKLPPTVDEKPETSLRRRALLALNNEVETPLPSHNLDDVRAWAAERGIPVSDRGRVPKAIRAAYEQDMANDD